MSGESEAAADFGSMSGVSPLLTVDACSAALTRWFGAETTFTHWEFAGDTGKGDSYLSDVMRVAVCGRGAAGERRRARLVLKTIPRSVARRLTFRSADFFANEIAFYREVLPALLAFAREAAPAFEPFAHARLFFAAADGERDVVCLEDASERGFRPAEARQRGLDLAHCEAALRALARLHALSLAMRDLRPAAFAALAARLSEVYFSERLRPWYARFWERIGAIAVDAVAREYPGSEYERRARAFCAPERYSDMIRAAADADGGVVSHGDCWANNFLFRSEGGATTALLVDFQLSRCASPALDVSFLVYACTERELRDRHYGALLRLYHDELAAAVRALGSDAARVYPWERFERDLRRYAFFGLAFSFESTPFVVLRPEDAIDMDVQGECRLDISDVWRLRPFPPGAARRREADNVRHAVDHGYI